MQNILTHQAAKVLGSNPASCREGLPCAQIWIEDKVGKVLSLGKTFLNQWALGNNNYIFVQTKVLNRSLFYCIVQTVKVQRGRWLKDEGPKCEGEKECSNSIQREKDCTRDHLNESKHWFTFAPFKWFRHGCP